MILFFKSSVSILSNIKLLGVSTTMLKSGVCEVAVVSERLAGEDNRLI